MSNDKVAATMHPRRTFKENDWVCVTVSENTWKIGQVEEVVLTGTVPHRYLVRFPEDETVPAPSYGWYFAAQVGPVPRIADYSAVQRSLADVRPVHPDRAIAEAALRDFDERFPAYKRWRDRHFSPDVAAETTGEHTKAKLEDNPYRNALDPQDVPPAPMPDTKHRVFYMPHEDRYDESLSLGIDYPGIEQRLRAGGSLTDEQARLFAQLSHRGPKRRRGLTPGEIALGMGIVGFIIVVFLFIAFTYTGW